MPKSNKRKSNKVKKPEQRLSAASMKFGRQDIYDEGKDFISRLMNGELVLGDELEAVPVKSEDSRESLPPFLRLPPETIERIFNECAHLKYPGEVPHRANEYSRFTYPILQVHKLSRVCQTFKNVLDNIGSKSILRVPVGVKITGLANCDPYFVETYAVHVYGGPGAIFPTRCVRPSEFVKAIHPGRITTNFSVGRVVLTDDLMAGILDLDLSQVEEVFFYDLVEIQLTNPVESMKKLLTKCQNVTTFDFSIIHHPEHPLSEIGKIFTKEIVGVYTGEERDFALQRLAFTNVEMEAYSRSMRRRSTQKKTRSHRFTIRNIARMKIAKRFRKRERRQAARTAQRLLGLHIGNN